MIVEVASVDFDNLRRRTPAEPSSEIKKRVDAARARQLARFAGSDTQCNARMTPAQMRAICILDEECTALMREAFDALGLTARSYDRSLRVARTVADLDGSDQIQSHHLAEAIRYRSFKLGEI